MTIFGLGASVLGPSRSTVYLSILLWAPGGWFAVCCHDAVWFGQWQPPAGKLRSGGQWGGGIYCPSWDWPLPSITSHSFLHAVLPVSGSVNHVGIKKSTCNLTQDPTNPCDILVYLFIPFKQSLCETLTVRVSSSHLFLQEKFHW
jgi:hypothetical protein